MKEYTVTVTGEDGEVVWSASGDTYVAGTAGSENGLLHCQASSDGPSRYSAAALACAVSGNVCESLRDAS